MDLLPVEIQIHIWDMVMLEVLRYPLVRVRVQTCAQLVFRWCARTEITPAVSRTIMLTAPEFAMCIWTILQY